jgi:hypothetical protein
MNAYDIIYRRRNGNNNGTEDVLADQVGIATLQSHIAVLDDVAIKALPTQAVVLVPAPGPGRLISFVRGTLLADFRANYGNIAPTSQMGIRYGSTTAKSPEVALGFSENVPARKLSALLSIGKKYASWSPPSFVAPFNIGPLDGSSVADKSLELYVDNAGLGNFTGGNAGNTLNVVLQFTIITLIA